MKTTIYELLGMIKDGKAPKRIVYKNNCYEWFDDEKDYITETHWLFDEYVITDILNDEVEILEATLNTKNMNITSGEIKPSTYTIEKLDISNGISVVNCAYKINEIIDKLNGE